MCSKPHLWKTITTLVVRRLSGYTFVLHPSNLTSLSPSKRRSVLGVHWKDWCWSWNSNTLATSWEELTHWKRPWCWEGLGAGGEGDNRGWDGWMASPTRWTWVWVNSGSWWWTGRPGVLWFMGLQRVRHDWATELNWTESCFGGFPGSSDSKESACNVGDLASMPGLRRSPGGEPGNPLQYFCLENSMDRGAWWVPVWGCRVGHEWATNTHTQSCFLEEISHKTPLNGSIQDHLCNILDKYTPETEQIKKSPELVSDQILNLATNLRRYRERECIKQYHRNAISKI